MGLVFRLQLGPGLAAFDRVHVEKRGDHRAGIGADKKLRQITRFNAQRGVEVDIQTIDHARHDGLRGRVQAARFRLEHGRRHGDHGSDFRVGRGAAGHFVVLRFPRMLRDGRGRQPGQGSAAHGSRRIRPGRRQRMHQPHLMGLARAESFALHQERHGRLQAQVPRHLGHAAGARQQAQRDFWKAQQDFRVIHRHAEMAQQRDFKTTAQRGAVQTSGDGHAE